MYLAKILNQNYKHGFPLVLVYSIPSINAALFDFLLIEGM
jgi:hypothetical protein